MREMRSEDYEAAFAAMPCGFRICEKEGVKWVTIPAIEAAGGVSHGFAMRYGGVSEGPFSTLNLGWNRPDDKGAIETNYRRLAKAAGFPYESMALVSYCHGDGVEIAHSGDGGMGFPGGKRYPDCDGLVTQQRDVTLTTLHADCMPVFLYDPVRRAGGMVHAGWRGASLRVGKKAVLKMREAFGCRPQDILAGVGPSICAGCFEVDGPVMEIFQKAFADLPCISWTEETQKYHVDLWRVMGAQLMEAGLLPEHITLSGLCTCHDEGFFSYRRDKKTIGETGAMAAFLRLL